MPFTFNNSAYIVKLHCSQKTRAQVSVDRVRFCNKIDELAKGLKKGQKLLHQ